MQTDRVQAVRRWVGDSKRWLAQFLEAARSIDSLVAIVVMGSALRDRSHRRSDFDLLIIYRGKRPAVVAPLEVDIRFAPIEGIEDKIAKGHEIVCWALTFGMALYDPECRWAQLQHSWRDRIPLPSAAEAKERGEKALARAEEMLMIGDESAADDLVLAALTQFVRERLILGGVFPASRPELPDQLRNMGEPKPLADMLEEAMYGESPPQEQISRRQQITQ